MLFNELLIFKNNKIHKKSKKHYEETYLEIQMNATQRGNFDEHMKKKQDSKQ